MTESLDKYIRSAIPGRVRVRHPAIKDEETAASLRTFLQGLPGVRTIEINPRVGSLLLMWDPQKLSLEDLKALAQAALPAGQPEPAKASPSPQSPRLPAAMTGLSPFRPSRAVNRAVNRVLTGSYALLMLGLVPGFRRNLALHVLAGTAFSAFLAWHMVRYRRTLV